MPDQARGSRQQLLREISQPARASIYGSLSETYRTCGNPKCRCHHGGPKNGPNLYISYRGSTAKTTGYYVPKAAEAQIARASRLGLNFRIARSPLSTKSASSPSKRKNRPFRNWL